MTTNQTIDGVPRYLLESMLDSAIHFEHVEGDDLRDLRALLDGVRLHKRTCSCVTDDTDVCDCGALVGGTPMPAAQPQGVPVAWMYKRKDQSEFGKPSQHIAFASPDLEECRTGRNAEGRLILTARDDYFDWRPLYAEPPAPVAVVLPERLKEIHEFLNGSGELDGYSFGSLHPSGRKYWWRNELRAFLDELKRLNSTRPNHANPPPGTEPSGTHHDNDGLDEWRKS